MGFSRQEYWNGVLLHLSKGHDMGKQEEKKSPEVTLSSFHLSGDDPGHCC